MPGFSVDRPRPRRIILPNQLMGPRDQTGSVNGGVVLGIEAKLWLAAR